MQSEFQESRDSSPQCSKHSSHVYQSKMYASSISSIMSVPSYNHQRSSINHCKNLQKQIELMVPGQSFSQSDSHCQVKSEEYRALEEQMRKCAESLRKTVLKFNLKINQSILSNKLKIQPSFEIVESDSHSESNIKLNPNPEIEPSFSSYSKITIQNVSLESLFDEINQVLACLNQKQPLDDSKQINQKLIEKNQQLQQRLKIQQQNLKLLQQKFEQNQKSQSELVKHLKQKQAEILFLNERLRNQYSQRKDLQRVGTSNSKIASPKCLKSCQGFINHVQRGEREPQSSRCESRQRRAHQSSIDSRFPFSNDPSKSVAFPTLLEASELIKKRYSQYTKCNPKSHRQNALAKQRYENRSIACKL